MVGVKFKPAAITHVFHLNMGELTEKVLPLSQVDNSLLHSFQNKVVSGSSHNGMIEMATQWLIKNSGHINLEGS
ncbi:MAG: hypothetical protein V4676_10265, partial [Bacteroidota bacterium]